MVHCVYYFSVFVVDVVFTALKCSFAGNAPHKVYYKEYYKRYEVTDNHKVITTLFTIYA